MTHRTYTSYRTYVFMLALLASAACAQSPKRNGGWKDDFKPLEVHVYRLSAR